MKSLHVLPTVAKWKQSSNCRETNEYSKVMIYKSNELRLQSIHH